MNRSNLALLLRILLTTIVGDGLPAIRAVPYKQRYCCDPA